MLRCKSIGTRGFAFLRPGNARFLCAAIFLAELILPSSTNAVDTHWTGATDTTWGTNGNWSGNAPGAGDNAVFDGTFALQPNLTGNKSVGGIWMTGAVGQDVTISASSGALTLQSNTINGTAGLGLLIDNASAFKLTITAPLKIGNAQTWRNNSGNLVTIGAGGVNLNGKALTLDGIGNFLITGLISNNGTVTVNSGGTRTFTGANTYTGLTTISGGVLNIQNATALGTTAGDTTVASGAALEIQFNIAVGAEALTLNGSGIASHGALRSVSGNNSFAGAITLASASTISSDAGTLTLTGGILNGGFAATFGGAGNISESNVISGTGALNKTGAGTMVLGGVNTYTGATNVTAGTLQISASDRIANTSNLNVAGGAFDVQTFNETLGIVTLSSGTISGSGTGTLTGSSYMLQSGTVSAILAGNGTVTKNTAGTVMLSGSNTFTGSTTISAGTLEVNTNNALGAAASGTTVANGAELKLNAVNYSTAEPLTLNGAGITNGGALTNSGVSTFAGPINVATSATINAGGGTLNLTGSIANSGTTVTIAGGGTVNINTSGITGGSANSNVVFDGTTVVLSAASSYNGSTTIQNSGTLKLGGNNLLPATPLTGLTINTSGTFDLASYSGSVASLTGDSTATLKNSVIGGTSMLTVNPASGSTTFAGIIAGTNGGTQGDVAVQKNGTGTLVLTGANTFTGSTTVNGGTLTLAAASGSALASTSNVTVNSGGTILLGASNQINNAATITLGGGTIAKGNFFEGSVTTPGMGGLTLTAAGSQIDFGTGTVGVLTFDSFNPGAYSLTIANWTGTLSSVGNSSTDRLIFASDQSANLSVFSFSGYAPGAVEFNLGNGYYEIAPVPETPTWFAGALTLGAVGVQLLGRRRKRTLAAE